MAGEVPAEFIRFLLGVMGSAYRCSICGNQQLNWNGADGNGSVAPTQVARLNILTQTTSIQPYPGNHAFYSISRSRCGRTDFFNAVHVEQWLRNNPVLPVPAMPPRNS